MFASYHVKICISLLEFGSPFLKELFPFITYMGISYDFDQKNYVLEIGK